MSDPLFARGTAALLGGGLVAGFAVLALFAALDRKNRTTIEYLTEPSAAGEAAVYVLPEPGSYDPATPILKVKEVPYYEDDVVRRADGSMMKAGHDDSGQYPLYRRYRNDTLQEEFYLKLAPGKFLSLSTKSPRKRLEGAPATEEATPEE